MIREVRVGDQRLFVDPAISSSSTVLLFHHRTGFDAFTDGIVSRLLAAGHRVIAPDLYIGIEADLDPEDRKSRLRDDAVLTMTERACLLARETWGPARPVALGFCMGGRLAFLAATTGLCAAAVCFYGGGLDVPWHSDVSPVQRVGPRHPPTQLHRGNRDSAATADQQEAAVRAVDRAGGYLEACTYAGARHAFLNPADSMRYHPEAARRAWSRAAAFISECASDAAADDSLRGPPGD